MKNNSSLRWLLAGAFFLAAQLTVSAHAFLDHSQPHVGGNVSQAPADVKIWFTQNVEGAFSSIQVDDSQGREVDKKDSHADPQNKMLMLVSLPALPPGVYTVTWHVVSVDTHKTRGHFKFTIKPAGK
jgi:methionine-rich copper-binding protein CopC